MNVYTPPVKEDVTSKELVTKLETVKLDSRHQLTVVEGTRFKVMVSSTKNKTQIYSGSYQNANGEICLQYYIPVETSAGIKFLNLEGFRKSTSTGDMSCNLLASADTEKLYAAENLSQVYDMIKGRTFEAKKSLSISYNKDGRDKIFHLPCYSEVEKEKEECV